MTENYIVIQKDFITPRQITVPYARIQDICVDQDLLDRIFGLYDVHLSSAAESFEIEAHIDGVQREIAVELKRLILEKVTAKMALKKAP